MNLKVGRNDPCPCGSGKKFKKCHINNVNELASLLFQRMRRPEPIAQNGQLIGRPFISTEFKGKKVVAVGSRVYHSLAPNTTFHEFIIIFLKDILGQQWGMTETQKPRSEQHLIVQWLSEMSVLVRTSPHRVEDQTRDIKSFQPSGNVLSLLSLAYDVYSVYHCAEFPEELLNRLRSKNQFQGAKYEIAVAAIFARAGFTIKWLPKSTESHCEFIATHKITKEQIILEAKSRHRKGVLGTPGEIERLDEMTAQVGQLFNKALAKPTNGLPFMIFIDINLPLTKGDNGLNKRWVNDIKKMLDKHPIGTPENPEPFTALFVTNFSWHYISTNTDIKKGETVTIVPRYSKYPLKNPTEIQLLHTASEQYGVVPPLFPDSTS